MGLQGGRWGSGVMLGSSQCRSILCSTFPSGALGLGILDGADADPGPSHHLGVHQMIDCLLLDLGIILKDQFIDRQLQLLS